MKKTKEAKTNRIKLLSNIAGKDIVDQNAIEARRWLIWTILGNIPLWIFLIPMVATPEPFIESFKKLATEGEFYFYSLSLLVSSYYVTQKNFKPFNKADKKILSDLSEAEKRILSDLSAPFPNNDNFNIIFFIAIIISASLGLIKYLVEYVQINSLTSFPILNINFIRVSSILLLLFSLFMGYIVSAIENSQKIHVDSAVYDTLLDKISEVPETRKHREKKLEEEIRKRVS